MKYLNKLNNFCKKIKKNIGMIYKFALYYVFINTNLMYCIAIWGNASKDTLFSLIQRQKRIIKKCFISTYPGIPTIKQ